MANMEPKDDLLRFISNFTHLLSSQLNAVQEDIEVAVETIMEGVSRISRESADQAVKADSVFVGGDSNYPVDGKKMSEVDNPKIQKLLKENAAEVSPEVAKATSNLRKYMDGFKNVDGALQTAILSIMGKLSTDDIIRQKVEHATHICAELAKLVHNMHLVTEKRLDMHTVEMLEADLLRKIQDSFTMKEEKVLFKKVFNS